MAAYSQITEATTGATITATIWNDEFGAVATAINSISNAQIAADAAIAYSKLNLTGNIVNADIGAAAAIAVTKIDFGTNMWTRHCLSLTSSDISAGTGKDEFTFQTSLPASKMVIETVEVEVDTAPGSGKTLTVDLNKAGSSILSSAISITDSSIINTGNTPSDTAIAADNRFTFDIDTATAGLSTTRVRVNIWIKQYFQTS